MARKPKSEKAMPSTPYNSTHGEEVSLILRAAWLREEMQPLKELERKYDLIRKRLTAIYLQGMADGRNTPMAAPGWLIAWKHVEKPSYTVAAHTEYHISILPMVAAE